MEPSLLISKLVRKESLTIQESETLCASILSDATPIQISAILTALQVKEPTSDELTGFVNTLRSQSVKVDSPVENHIDTCGTGGGVSSFNVSTAAAIIAAAAGATVAKHGNRAVTGRFGSADVLEAIGIPLCTSSESASALLRTSGFAFMYAPNFHPAVAKVGSVRKELPFRTIFNVLGPLLNPAGAKRQIIGVYDPALLTMVAGALKNIGTEFSVVAHGEPGLDEISPISLTQVCIVKNGEITREEWQPSTFGAQPVTLSALLAGQSAEENGALLVEAVTKVDSPRAAAVMPSAAVAICLAGLAEDWKAGYELARETVRSGKSEAKLTQLRSNV
jgi:anthranilate phosphoribosyltransferase